MSALLAISDQFRALLASREAMAVAQMMAAYMQVRGEIEATLEALTADIEAAQARGEDITLSWLFRQERYHLLLRQTDQQIASLVPFYDSTITGEQLEAVQLALEAFEQLTMFQLPPDAVIRAQFTRLPVSALEHLVGATADGSPLRDLLDQLGPDASKRVRDELIRGVGAGRNPRDTARKIRDALDGNMTRANAISRTEQHRAYRAAHIESYTQNQDVVDGWIWHSALDERTCMSCVTMHGRFFSADEPFGSHVSCRCSPIPKTKTFAELGFTGIPETSIDIEPGITWFERQPEAIQIRMMGPSKFAAWKSGAISLDDISGFKVDRKWGPVRWERSLIDMLSARQAAQFYQQAAADD